MLPGFNYLKIAALHEGHRSRLRDFGALISMEAVLRMIETLYYQRRSLKDGGYSIHSILSFKESQ
jgi:hypothetical protein